MASNTVTISGMFGNGKTYFAGSPVVIDISGLRWSEEGQPVTSPFTIVRVEVVYDSKVVGEFKDDTGGQPTATFDISSALQAIWAGETFQDEISDARDAANGSSPSELWVRAYKPYSLKVYTEYLSSDGVFTTTDSDEISGGRCAIGGFTERERSTIPSKEAADVSYREHENLRYGDASTKPTDTPERVGSMSITSWVDVQSAGTQSVFYPASAQPAADSQTNHAPLVLRDNVPYVDFLFLNRRGAVETCSGQTLESMGINVKVTQYSRTERPSFNPVRSLMAIGQDGRRSWQMSSGYVTREWAEWWALEFLGGKRKQWWMRYPIGDPNGTYVPVIVEPSKQNISIYDRAKQNMAHVDFTVTLALEG